MVNEPVCVRHADTVEEAGLIVAWLEEQGLEATIIGQDSPGVVAFGVTDREGVAVCVADAEMAERARSLLELHDAEPKDGMPGTFLDVTCEDCGEVCSYSDELRGTVQECTACGAYVDVGIGEE